MEFRRHIGDGSFRDGSFELADEQVRYWLRTIGLNSVRLKPVTCFDA